MPCSTYSARGDELVGLSQDDDGVTAEPDTLAAANAEIRKTQLRFGISPAAAGTYRVVVPAEGVSEDRMVPPTLAELKQRLQVVAGTDFGVHSPRWLSRFGDATRLAEQYRTGRVDHVCDVSEELDAPAVLLRPDGHVAWVGDDQDELLSHLPTWFGAA